MGRTEGEEAMMDFNSTSSISGQITALVDAGMQRARAQQSERQYLGASRLGAACERALQFEYAKAPVDHGRDTPGRMLRIFERGHVMEDCMVAWLRDAGFDLRTRKADGEQFGFSVADGRLQGHVDGVVVAGPEVLALRLTGAGLLQPGVDQGGDLARDAR